MFDLCGFVGSSSGAEVIPPRFEIAQPFYEGLAAVRIQGLAAVRIQGLRGYVDPTWEVAIASQVEQAGPFRNGFAEVVISNRTGALDRAGQVVIEPRFARIVPFAGAVFLVTEGDDALVTEGDDALVTEGDDALVTEGDEVWSPKATRPVGWTSALSASSRSDFDVAGSTALARDGSPNPGYEVRFFDRPKQGAGLVWARTAMESTAPWGVFASDETWVVSPRYETVQPVSEGRAVVRGASGPMLTHPLSGRPVAASGAVDEAGILLLPPQFDDMQRAAPYYAAPYYAAPYCTVTKGAQSYPIDRTGAEVALPTYSDAQRTAALTCRKGSRLFAGNGLRGLRAADGAVLIAPIYRTLTCFDGGIAWAAAEGAKEWCPIDPERRERRAPDCRTTVYPLTVSHFGPERLDPDPFESPTRSKALCCGTGPTATSARTFAKTRLVS